ncbi:MAG: hypothetical protein JNL98_30480 [Bryobacterales bacterium]|nr:hypothetical protein [Bryobacterales bacterium]
METTQSALLDWEIFQKDQEYPPGQQPDLLARKAFGATSRFKNQTVTESMLIRHEANVLNAYRRPNRTLRHAHKRRCPIAHPPAAHPQPARRKTPVSRPEALQSGQPAIAARFRRARHGKSQERTSRLNGL